ncbi:MAG: response regulator [Steroidobacteraceae bacterium]
MSTVFEQTTILTSTRSVPRRVLVVNDDPNLLTKLTSHLTQQDMEVSSAANGEEALTLLARQWIPLVLTADHLPVMNGIELTQRVRAMAAKPTYIIMLTSNIEGAELERGYCAGVDHYVVQKNWESSLSQRVVDGFAALRLRRGAVRKIANDSVVTVDLQSGAHTARHLVGRLNAELMLARSRGDTINVAVLGVHGAQNARGTREAISEEQLSAVLGSLKSAVRPKFDWVAWLHQANGTHRFLIVLSNLQGNIRTLEQSIRNTFVAAGKAASGGAPVLSFGTTVFNAGVGMPPPALALLAQAESARRAAKDAVSGFSAVQRDDA